MIFLYALLIGSHDSYHWNLTCPDFEQVRISVMLDENISMKDKYNVLNYLKSKTVEDCSNQTFS
tara:strand:- start:2344 stop:2535 length:192 start_codon:yes stop_codon:yes gene_type:complete